MTPIQPIQAKFSLDVLSQGQLQEIKAATMHVLQHIGVEFPSKQALQVFSEHGAQVNWENQIVKLPPDLVFEAVQQAPRVYRLAGRIPGRELWLDGKNTYFGTDGCGTTTLDLEGGFERPSCKGDVAQMARVADFLPSIAFYWPIVSAQDCGPLAPLHELETCFKHTTKHIQLETVVDPNMARYAVRMAEVIAGDREQMHQNPPLSSLICTVAPLGQDKQSIEAAMVYAQSGIPVGFMSMPNMGSTAPATPAGALVIGNAEVISAIVLMQLIAPGAPVFHSLLASVMDPRTAEYVVSLPDKYLCNLAAVQIAHDWGMPSLAGAFGMEHAEPASWMVGRDNVYTSLMVPLAGAELVVASGLLRASTLLVPEQIIFDDDTYHVNRIISAGIDTTTDALGLDAIASAGVRGHYLAQKHTRKYMRKIWFSELTHPAPSKDETFLEIRQRARLKFDQILAQHQPPLLEKTVEDELNTILKFAQQELINQ